METSTMFFILIILVILFVVSFSMTIFSFVHYHKEVQSHIGKATAKISNKIYSFTAKNGTIYSGSTTQVGRGGGYVEIYYVKQNPSQNGFITSTHGLEKYITEHYVKNTWKIVGIILACITPILFISTCAWLFKMALDADANSETSPKKQQQQNKSIKMNSGDNFM